jgi:hypothetical protein
VKYLVDNSASMKILGIKYERSLRQILKATAEFLIQSGQIKKRKI